MLNFRCLIRLNPYFSQSLYLLKYHLLHYSTAVTSTTSDSYANYLADSLGFSRQQALSISNKLSHTRRNKVIDPEFVENANSVVTLFRNLGFHDNLLRIIVSKELRLLASNVNQTLKPKIRALQDEDFSTSDIIRVISTRPTILFYGLESTILPAIQNLRQVMGSNSYVINTIERLGVGNFRNVVKCLLPNVALLSSYGVPIELIRKQFLCQPGYFAQNPEAFKYLVTGADQKLGMAPHSPMFFDGIKFISGISKERFQSNCRIFKSFGWTQTDIETFILKYRKYFPFSDESIKKKLDFLMNELQLKPAVITSCTGFISCSLEKRILPRYRILQILKEKGLMNKNLSLYTVNQLSEPCFLERFVLPFREVHEAYAKLISDQMLNLRYLAALARLNPFPQSLHFLIYHLHYSTAVTSTTSDSYSNYFVDLFGFSRQQALSISTNLTLKRRNKVIDSEFVVNANSVVTFFRNLGFHQTHIRNIVSREPRLLASKVDKTLKPKIRALLDEDFSLPDIIRVISRRPEILVYSLESTILPTVHILKQVMGSVSNVVNSMERLRETCFSNIVNCLLPNVALLTSFGLPIESIRKHMLYRPWYLVRNPQVFEDVVMKKLATTRDSQTTDADYFVDSLGFSRQQALFISTTLYGRRRNKVIDSKFVENANSVVALFHNLGFDDTLLRIIVSEEPRLLTYNVDKTLEPKIRFLQDENFSASDIIRIISTHPTILLYGLEPTILPVIQNLRQVMGSNSYVIDTIERLNQTNFRKIVKCLLPNVALLGSYGVPIELIRKQLLFQPWYLVQNPEVFKDAVMRDDTKLQTWYLQ